jgi:predicted DCC family thiol-disulfide oxidoreductase YuxK
MSASGSEFEPVAITLPVLIYDGDCAFCSSTVRTLQKLIKNPPKIIPFQFIDTTQFGLTKQQCSEEIKFVDANGLVSGGESAFKKFFFEVGGAWRLLGGVMGLPLIRQISGVIYRWVAKNRFRLPGGTPTCSLPRKYE